MFDCKKCGKELDRAEFSYKYHIDHRRGKKSRDKFCSECN